MFAFSLYVSFLMFYCTAGLAGRARGAGNLDTENCTIEEKGTKCLELCVEREVIGFRGGSATFPCSFTYQSNKWKIKNLTFVIFTHHSKNGKRITGYDDKGGIEKMKRFEGRVEKMEKPKQGLWSMEINNLRVEDENTYVCRFMYNESEDGINWGKSGFEPRNGKRTKLWVDVQPKILNISKEFVNSSNSWRVICEGEAKPGPNITWLNPKGLPVNGAKIASSPNGKNGLQNITSTLTITGEDPEGQYTCLVKNKYGMAQDHVIHLTNTGKQWIVIGCSIALSLVLLLLFAVGLHIYRKKRNPREGSQALDGTTSHQGPNEEDELTYVTLAIKMNETPRPATPNQSEDTSIYAVVKK
uniref:carcinoembryonic antigen-related cell adhesion molecule 1-like n=1 Tax=Myxine glutinosa TaxID=7769 RepID=UPI00358F2646